MKIQAKNEKIKSMKLNVPVDGLIEIDKDGVATVSDKCGKMLIEGTNDWKPFGEVKDTKEGKKGGEQPKEGDEQDKDNEGEEPKNDEGGESETEKMIASINSMSLDECIATATEAGYPKNEWEKLSKNSKAAEKLMRNYLVKKYKAEVAE